MNPRPLPRPRRNRAIRPFRTSLLATAALLAVLTSGCGNDSEEISESRAASESLSGAEAAESASDSNSGTALGGAIVFREETLTDPGMNNTVVSTVLVPEGWKTEGGAIRPGSTLFNMPVLIDYLIESPDGRSMHFFPSLSFEFNTQQNQFGGPAPKKLQPLQSGNFYYPLPESPGAWMVDLASLNPAEGVTDLNLVSEEDMPEITSALRQQNAQRYQMTEQMNQTTASMGFGSEFDTQATKVVLEYKKDGRVIEETVVMTWLYEVMINQGQVTGGSWNVLSMQSMGGPKGTNYLEDPALNAIYQSVRMNPKWTAEMNKYWMELARIKHKGNMAAIKSAGKISQIQAESSAAVSDIIMKGWTDRNASSDRIQAKTVDAIQEQTVYNTPSGEEVKLPSFYENVYTDGNGRYLLHNDAMYEPNRDPAVNGQDWERIEAAR
ncbi:MAG: hypothetical protein AB8G23_01400 [Myxococcota bacterium]